MYHILFLYYRLFLVCKKLWMKTKPSNETKCCMVFIYYRYKRYIKNTFLPFSNMSDFNTEYNISSYTYMYIYLAYL